MSKFFRRAVVATLAAAFIAGTGAAPAQAAPSPRAVVVAQVQVATPLAAPAPVAPASSNVEIPQPGTVEAQRTIAKIRAIVGAAWGALKTAVRAGLAAFQRWLASQPKAVRWALSAIGSPTTLFQILLCLIYGIGC